MRIPLIPSGRRLVVLGAGAFAALARSAAAATWVATPRQTEGPYYPLDWSGDADSDLVQVQGEAARATGEVLHLHGRVLDTTGTPIATAQVEIWQCDAHGVYRHPRDESPTRRREPGFQGRGRAISDAQGVYRFRTIRPVPYPGRAPHIHVKVTSPGRRPLITQFYVADEPLNARDSLFNALRDARQRERVLMRLAPAEQLEPGARVAVVDIVL